MRFYQLYLESFRTDELQSFQKKSEKFKKLVVSEMQKRRPRDYLERPISFRQFEVLAENIKRGLDGKGKERLKVDEKARQERMLLKRRVQRTNELERASDEKEK